MSLANVQAQRGTPPVPLQVVDAHFYHLDTCLLLLPGGRVAYFPGVFSEESLRVICRLVPHDSRLEVEIDDADGLACIAVVLGTMVIAGHASDLLHHYLSDWELDVVVCPLDKFLRVGAGARCLIPYLIRAAPAATSSALDEGTLSTRTKVAERTIEITGHVFDQSIFSTVLDTVERRGGYSTCVARR